MLMTCLLLVCSATPVMAAKGAYRAASPEYGLSVFVYDQPTTTARDLSRVQTLGFGWVRSLFRWTDIEHDYKGEFYPVDRHLPKKKS